ncbi:peptidase inhibitor family I36 protein [Micromonospora echinofusca]|uniref:peptidase inhibitor family I36 protein n=1 Tax=Micromonospora echinofusca TaxID=47858 RepID=UPI000C71344C
MLLRFARNLLATSAILVASSAVVATPASAGLEECNIDHISRVCMWTGSNYTGIFRSSKPSPYPGTQCTSDADRSYRSAENLSTYIIVFYSGSNCTGSSTGLSPTQEKNLGFAAWSWRAHA